jgi:hypothetical protein
MDEEIIGLAMTGDRIALTAGFAMTRRGLPSSISLDDVASEDTTLPLRHKLPESVKKTSLNNLLRLLWSQSELNHWVPRMEGKRNWGLIRHLLSQEAATVFLSGVPLESRLFIPEVFRSSDIDKHRERNVGELERLLPIPEKHTDRKQFSIVIGIAKTYRSSKYGCKLVLKHLPETVFYLDARLARSITKTHTFELLAIGRAHTDPVLTIMVVERTENGNFAVVDLSFIRLTKEWIPANNAYEAELITYLVGRSRSFVSMSGSAGADLSAPAVYLTDVGIPPIPLYIDGGHHNRPSSCIRQWCWAPSLGAASSFSLPETA